MKKVIICTMLLILSTTTFCQQVQSSEHFAREKYITKSKTQKICGFILLGVGATTLIAISKGNTDMSYLGPLAVFGTLSTLGSIPLFIASGRNKRKGRNISTSLNIEKSQTMREAEISFHPLPALSIKIDL